MSLEEIINWNEVSEDKRIDLLERPTQVIRKDQNEIIEKIFAAVSTPLPCGPPIIHVNSFFIIF